MNSTTALLPPAAPLGRRFKAFVLDYVVISAYLVALAILGALVYHASDGAASGPPSRLVMELVAFGTTVLPVTLYFALQEGGPAQASWGKRRAGIRVTTRDGGRATLGRALGRNGLKLLPWQVAHTSLFHIPGWPLESEDPSGLALIGLIVSWGLVLLYLLVMLTSGCRRTPYDRVAGTVVTDAD